MSKEELLIDTNTSSEFEEIIRGDGNILKILEPLTKNIGLPIEDIIQDVSKISAAKVNLLRKASLTEEQARMEGLHEVSEEDIKILKKSLRKV